MATGILVATINAYLSYSWVPQLYSRMSNITSNTMVWSYKMRLSANLCYTILLWKYLKYARFLLLQYVQRVHSIHSFLFMPSFPYTTTCHAKIHFHFSKPLDFQYLSFCSLAFWGKNWCLISVPISIIIKPKVYNYFQQEYYWHVLRSFSRGF